MKLLDLFCGAGGAAMGYHQAGFDEIVGVDNRPMPRYPFTFVQADALEYVRDHGQEFDAIHASPPCQAYSVMRNLPWLRDKQYPKLIQPTVEALERVGRPWVIENVLGARLASGWLCGRMFGKAFYRHRFFWSGGWFWLQPPHPKHRGVGTMPSMTGGLERHFRRNATRRTAANIGHAAGFELAKKAMECEWMRREELTQAVPPVYTEFIGRQLLAALATLREGAEVVPLSGAFRA